MKSSNRLLMFTFAIFAFSTLMNMADCRAVNISNTWTLPEEDFPVFYRHFRDRISWYEADAVCQFHHANLVTADTSSQYDAIRAYLKELDITDNVWIGLSKKSDSSEFTWSDSRMLTGEGHWKDSLPVGGEPLCVTMDPTADFLWSPYSCGGPEAASFICELPVPSWALGQKGCLLTELPSLTVLYIPEQMALELTSDCGLDGTKRIMCKGNADREDLLKQLTCSISQDDDFDDKISSKLPSVFIESTTHQDNTNDTPVEESSASYAATKTTKPFMWTSSNTIETGYEMSTRHRRETEDTLSPSDATASYVKVTEPVTESHEIEEDVEVSTLLPEEESTVVVPYKSNSSVSTSHKNDILEATNSTDSRMMNTEKTESTVTTFSTTTNAEVKSVAEDIAEYPSAINQGQLFSIIENGTMFDIIELNDTALEESKTSKETLSQKTNRISTITTESTSPSSTSTTTTEKATSYTTIVYFKEPPPESAKVTNKFPKKVNKQSKTKYYKKSDPKNINFQSEKDQRKNKEERLNSSESHQNPLETDKDLNKEVEMFPVIAEGGPLVKLNRTHRKELPIIDENEKNIFKSPIGNSPILSENNDDNELELIEENKHVEIRLEKKNDSNASGIFIVTTKFIDETRGRKKNESHHDTVTKFSEIHNATKSQINISSGKTTSSKPLDQDYNRKLGQNSDENLPPPMSTRPSELIDPKIEELNKNIPFNKNNETEEVLPKFFDMKATNKDDSVKRKYNETLSKSLLGEIETITDDIVIENNTQEVEKPTSEPLNSEPFTVDRPNRKRKLTNTQRRSFYPYFFSRVLG